MFYSHDILARKGPLGTIWIAAHLDRKLRKNQVLETDITVSVEAILSADLQKVLALRLSGHLLLGITRIFNRKVNYLYENCETALDKLKQAYKKGNVDLPKEQAVARYEDVTLPDQYVLPDLDAYSEIYATPLLTKKGDKYRGKPEELVIVEKVVANPFDTFDDEMLEPSQDLNFGGPVDGECFAPQAALSQRIRVGLFTRAGILVGSWWAFTGVIRAVTGVIIEVLSWSSCFAQLELGCSVTSSPHLCWVVHWASTKGGFTFPCMRLIPLCVAFTFNIWSDAAQGSILQ